MKAYLIAALAIALSSCNEAGQFSESRVSRNSAALGQDVEKSTAKPLESNDEKLIVQEPVSVGGAFLTNCAQVERSNDLITIACTLTHKDTNELANDSVDIRSIGLEAEGRELAINPLENSDNESLRFSFAYDGTFKRAQVNLVLSSLWDGLLYEESIPFDILEDSPDILEDSPAEPVFNLVTATVETFKLGNDGLDNFVSCTALEKKAIANDYFGSSAAIEFEVLAAMPVTISILGICDNGRANASVTNLANYQLIKDGQELISERLPQKGSLNKRLELEPGLYRLEIKPGVQATGNLDDFLVDSVTLNRPLIMKSFDFSM